MTHRITDFGAVPPPVVREFYADLLYASYRTQRLRRPDVSAERWAVAFPDTYGPHIGELEARFQAERRAP